MTEELILIDAYSQIFRAFYAIRQLTNSRGEPTNAVHVFARLLLNIHKEYPQGGGAMLFDCGKVQFRKNLNPEYKANRPPTPEALQAQIPVIRELAESFGWPLLSEPEYEADDLAAAFARSATGKVKIISSDKDLAQLVNERITMLVPASGKGGFEERGIAEITAKYQVPPELIVDYLSLLGDSSDNIPGVPGIGAKGAAQLLNTYGPIMGILEHPEKVAGSSFAKKLAGQQELIQRNIKLIKLRDDLPERFTPLDKVLTRRAPDWGKIAEIARKMELNSFLRDLPATSKTSSQTIEEQTGDLFAQMETQQASPAEEAPAEAPSETLFEQQELF